MKPEVTSEMPIGYIKGNSYLFDWDYDRFAAMPVFELLSRYAMKQGYGLHFTYSYITRAYDCEVRKVEYFKHSAQPYFLGVANRGGANPLEAAVNALRTIFDDTPMFSVLCLEAECVLLGLAVDKARDLEERIDKALNDLGTLLNQIAGAWIENVVLDLNIRKLPTLFPGVRLELLVPGEDLELTEMPGDYECENCIGMIEHGCYCKANGAPSPGGPAGIPADPGEDDDL